jgi:endonuclease/exonuclease/phosphatase family metal-dependent hydrolase
MHKGKLIFKFLGIVVLIVIMAFAGLLVYSTLTDFSPESGSVLNIVQEGDAAAVPGDTISILIWNIGYAGLGKEMDFFNDGGSSVRPEKDLYERYISGICSFLINSSQKADILLLQEVDRNSKRSYFNDQVDVLRKKLGKYNAAFALNYDVKFVPVPFGFPYTPYGKTFGGLVTFSTFAPISSQRVQYPGGFSWPTSLYMLDRCALEQRFRTSTGKEVVIVNTHNTAYDATGEIKAEELRFMKERYGKLAESGARIIIGGDWNQVPPGYLNTREVEEGYTPQSLEMNQLPEGFSCWFDPKMETNRSNRTAYVKGQSYETLIDYFVVSPGIKLLEIKGIDLGFDFSDHNPVMLTCVFE